MTSYTLEFLAALALYGIMVLSFALFIALGIEVWWGGNRTLKEYLG